MNPEPAEQIQVEALGTNAVRIFFPNAISREVMHGLLVIIQEAARKRDIWIANAGVKYIPSDQKGGGTECMLGIEESGNINELLVAVKESLSEFLYLREPPSPGKVNTDFEIVKGMERAQRSIDCRKLNDPKNSFKIRFSRYDEETATEILKILREQLQLRNIANGTAQPMGDHERLPDFYIITGTKIAPGLPPDKAKMREPSGALVDCSEEMEKIIQKTLSRFIAAERKNKPEAIRTMLKFNADAIQEKNSLESALKIRLGMLDPHEKFWGSEDMNVTAELLVQGIIRAFDVSRLPRTFENKAIEATQAIKAMLGSTYAQGIKTLVKNTLKESGGAVVPVDDVVASHTEKLRTALTKKLMLALRETLEKYNVTEPRR